METELLACRAALARRKEVTPLKPFFACATFFKQTLTIRMVFDEVLPMAECIAFEAEELFTRKDSVSSCLFVKRLLLSDLLLSLL